MGLEERFASLWQERSFTFQTLEDVKRAIVSELNDELTHPRARRTRAQKLVYATERVVQAELSPDEKAELLLLYVKTFEQLQKE